MIIDFHVHTFPDKVAGAVTERLGAAACIEPSTDATVSGLTASMQQAGIACSVNLPVATSARQVVSINDRMIRDKADLENRGVIPFGAMHPDFADYRGELRRLAAVGIRGIKLHPAYQGVDLTDIRYKRILAAASELDLITTIHAGIDVGIHDRNYASVPQILEILREAAPTRLVLAHMGGWNAWEEVERDLAGAPVWLDTAFTIGPITPHHAAAPGPYSGITLSDDDFVRLVRAHGTDRVLFATDCPWQDQSRYVRRFHALPFTEEEREQLFHTNAQQLLGWSS